MESLEERAKEFAAQQHGTQEYRRGVSYLYHLGYVVGVLERFGIDDETAKAIAWLHDVLEDTSTTYSDLQREFGDRIAEAVCAMTERPTGTRAEKHERTYPNIARLEIARLVKLADRISNVEAGGPKVQMYSREHRIFFAYLGIEGRSSTEKAMWSHLNSLLGVVV